MACEHILPSDMGYGMPEGDCEPEGFEPEVTPCRDCNGVGWYYGDGYSEDTQLCGSCGGRGVVPA